VLNACQAFVMAGESLRPHQVSSLVMPGAARSTRRPLTLPLLASGPFALSKQALWNRFGISLNVHAIRCVYRLQEIASPDKEELQNRTIANACEQYRTLVNTSWVKIRPHLALQDSCKGVGLPCRPEIHAPCL
jgi:hypothetical protein